MKTNKGFTLIELLVVVLIIGILAAIAVPQYNLAVEKSRVAQVLSAVKTIAQAEEIFYLTNNRYTDNIKDLDINIIVPTGWKMKLVLTKTQKKVEFSTLSNYEIHIIYHYKNSGNPHAGTIYCFAFQNDSFAQKLCRSIAKEEINSEDNNLRMII